MKKIPDFLIPTCKKEVPSQKVKELPFNYFEDCRVDSSEEYSSCSGEKTDLEKMISNISNIQESMLRDLNGEQVQVELSMVVPPEDSELSRSILLFNYNGLAYVISDKDGFSVLRSKIYRERTNEAIYACLRKGNDGLVYSCYYRESF